MRYGNGWIAELVEWACRTYGWRVDYVTDGLPAVQLALLYRCYAQGPCGQKGGTLMNDELAAEEGWDEPKEDDIALPEGGSGEAEGTAEG